MKSETHDGTADESRRKVENEAPKDGRGGQADPPSRALTLAEKLYNVGILSFDEWQAATDFRHMHFDLHPPSEGVSSYGQASGRADPTRKGDRKAKRITGIEVLLNGDVKRGESRDNKAKVWQYRDAIFAIAGVHDTEGNRLVDPQICRLMVRACIDSESMPTQTEIGRARASYIKDDGSKPSKQVTAIGAFFVKEHLRRLAMHFGMTKGEKVK